MIEVTYQMVLNTIQTIALVVGIIYYLTIMRNAQKTRELTLRSQENATETRQAQLFMNIYDTYSSKQYQKDRERMFMIWEYEDYDDFFRKYGPDVAPDEHAIWDMFCSHFEGIAVLVKRGLIDSELVYDLMYSSIIFFWEKFETVLLGLRERHGPRAWEDLEYLYNEMKRLQAIEK